MTFALGAASRARLANVHPRLADVVRIAITISAQDFAVHCGLRTLAAQRQHVREGTSWTLNSKHLPQADGLSHAVDLVPWIGGKPSWDWPGCYEIASAMARAAAGATTALIWGGVWDRTMSAFGSTAEATRRASLDYVARRKAIGKRAAIDGPHFELA